jgi:predicted CoA-substrate-specific enzyme activase
MITAGIDAGAQRIKAAILSAGELLSFAVIAAGDDSMARASKRTLEVAISQARISAGDITSIVATGMGRRHLSFAHTEVSEATALARGTNWFLPSAGTVLDIGAQKSIAVRCREGEVLKTRANDRCATGSGRYLEMVAEILGVGVQQLGEMSLRSEEDLSLQSTCTVFAESEIITLVHLRKQAEDIAKAAVKGLTERMYTLLLLVGWQKDLSLVGGAARNVGLVRALEELTGSPVLVPNNPDIVAAVGAALPAQQEVTG